MFSADLFFLDLLFLAFYAWLFVAWPWALLECLVRESGEGNTKITWTLAILFAPIVGAFAYLLVRRPHRIEELGR